MNKEFGQFVRGTKTGMRLSELVLMILVCLLIEVLAYWVQNAQAQVNPAAIPLLPVLGKEAKFNWPELHFPSIVAAQVDKETCITQTHRFCWNPRAELKTPREYGFGLGQFTTAYTADGKERFNIWRDLRNDYPDKLIGWTWENRYDPQYQIRAMVLHDRALWRTCKDLMDEALACTFSSYNGGLQGVMSDRSLCSATPGCNPRLWFGNVEKHSLKARIRIGGYGESFYDINRRYVREVLYDRRTRYVPLLEVQLDH